jgi:hypothetical protein
LLFHAGRTGASCSTNTHLSCLSARLDLQRVTFLPAAVRSGRHSETASFGYLGMMSGKDDFDVDLTFPSSDEGASNGRSFERATRCSPTRICLTENDICLRTAKRICSTPRARELEDVEQRCVRPRAGDRA